MDNEEHIKQILISELGKPTKLEKEHIISHPDYTFLKEELPQIINQKKSKAFFATTTAILTFAIIGLYGYNFISGRSQFKHVICAHCMYHPFRNCRL